MLRYMEGWREKDLETLGEAAARLLAKLDERTLYKPNRDARLSLALREADRDTLRDLLPANQNGGR